MSDLKITSFDDLVAVSKGEVVELPPFSEKQRFVARLKRPSFMEMVRAGTIPNELLTEANKMFAKGAGIVALEKSSDPNMMSNMLVILDEICKASFVEPSYDDIVKAGVQLTDEQRMFVFSYSQSGVKALKSFCKQRGDSKGNRGSQAVGTDDSDFTDDGNK